MDTPQEDASKALKKFATSTGEAAANNASDAQMPETAETQEQTNQQQASEALKRYLKRDGGTREGQNR